MTESKELRVLFGELTLIALQCPHCGAETVINVADDRQRRAWQDDRAVSCGVCGAGFETSMKAAVTMLANAYRHAKQAQEHTGAVLAFRVRLDEGRYGQSKEA